MKKDTVKENQLEINFNPPAKLNPKDTRIMQLYADGLRISEISAKANINQRTIESRVEVLKKRFKCKSLTHLAITLLKANLIK